MGQQQSKDELLYQQVGYGNTEGIKALSREGAGLEWIDKDGKTPLIVASMNPELYNVAKTLIELGANVNAYRPGRHAGTALHHAAKRGLQNTVKLLLLHGANALIMNDDCQTPLDVAREKGHTNVVRTIELHICLFSGWMREFHGPGFLEAWAPQLLSRKVWVVILPSGSRHPTRPFKLQLAIYSGAQDAQPRTVIALWKSNLEEPKSNQSDPSVTIFENFSKTRIKLAPEKENDRQQLEQFCNACKGIPQARPAFLHDSQNPVPSATAPPDAEDYELALAISASIQSALEENPPLLGANLSSEASASNSHDSDLGAPEAPGPPASVEWTGHGPSPSGKLTENNDIQLDSVAPMIQPPDLIASAPPIVDGTSEDGPIHYPSIDLDPIDISSPSVESSPAKLGDTKEDKNSSCCVICLDAPIEGACIPCGHMAGCMSCLNEIKAKKWGCPVCRAQINQVVRLYAV
ncbi:Putative E3 ubiquitin-protein ligase XBAT35 [Morus notabilis]|uniref:Putative E3 ubiquitin-protein ligase XBAT35 n=1 Tax=Morus notabilis TaxID=981085 RepID=W9SE19_9ROSA|nr:putative E3 ubiquitin-protein ligase XBAT35 isoform X2 [Morus notabilis]EXC01806.1 Putative E3 ubiquitin-protein ligase XBAT35 [Morus notabilis]